jgi:hypothetical protein
MPFSRIISCIFCDGQAGKGPYLLWGQAERKNGRKSLVLLPPWTSVEPPGKILLRGARVEVSQL